MAPPEGGDAPASAGASGMRVISCILTEHDLRLVFLAAFVIVSGGWLAFGLFHRAEEKLVHATEEPRAAVNR